MRKHTVTRRRFLRDLGVSTAAVPFLVGLDSLYAHAQVPMIPKKRFIVLYSPNGMLYENWRLPATGLDIDISTGTPLAGATQILSPLQPNASKILILDRLSLVGARPEFNVGHPGGHQKGLGNLLTGQTLIGGDNTVVNAGLANGISLDQELATKIFAGKSKFPSLELGVQVDENLTDRYVCKRLSYDGPAKPRTPVNDPFVLFKQVFGDSNANGAALRRFLDQSVLDNVIADFQRLQPKLSTADRALLQQHSESIRKIETQLTTVVACSPMPLTAPNGVNVTNPVATHAWAMLPANFTTVATMQTDIMVQAIACGLTNIATFMYSFSETSLQYPWLPQPVLKGHHVMSHARDVDLVKIDQWYAGEFNKLINKMSAIPESGGTGTLLDNSLMMWTSCLSDGAAHTSINMPITLAGSNGGFFKTGRAMRFNAGVSKDEMSPNDLSNSDLMVSILNSFGVQTNTFGDPRFAHGPLPGVKKV